MSSSTVHPVSSAGFGAGNSEHYNKVRPSYADEAYTFIRKSIPKKEGLRVVELGSGTGIFTRNLLNHPDWTSSISEIRCVDPNEGMRAVFAETISDTRVTLVDGTFDRTGAPDGWADLIVAASAIHWCRDFEAATKEFVRIAAPGCVISFLVVFLDKEVPWVDQIFKSVQRYHAEAGSTEEMQNSWKQMLSLPEYIAHFEPPKHESIITVQRGTRESVTGYLLSASWIAVQPQEEKTKIVAAVNEIFDRGDGLVWLDKEKGEFEVPLKTETTVILSKA